MFEDFGTSVLPKKRKRICKRCNNLIVKGKNERWRDGKLVEDECLECIIHDLFDEIERIY
jgi:RNase P subunit RPR2